MQILRLITFSLLGFAVSFLFLPTRTQADALRTTEVQPSQNVRFTNEYLTVKARDVPLRTLLRKIASQSGLTLVLPDPFEDRISIEFNRLSLDEGLRRILRRQNFALEYSQETSQEKRSTISRPKKLWIYPKKGEDYPARITVVDDTKASTEQSVALVSPRLQTALTSEDSWDRKDAVEALGESGRPEVIVPLSLALHDEDRDVREAAIDALADIGGTAAAQAVAIALQDQDASIREEAVEALGAIGGAEAAQALVIALQDNDASIREEAVEGLAKIGGAEATKALAIALHDGDSWVREEAVEALGNIGGEKAIRLLELALGDDDESVRSAAAKTLVRVRNSSAKTLP